MKPINAPERRKAFFTYLFVFLITLLPICLSLYLYGRVDHVENAFLRGKYVEKLNLKEVKFSSAQTYNDLENSVNDLNTEVIKRAPRAKSDNYSGEIAAQNLKFKLALEKIQENAGALNPTESLLLRIIEKQTESIKKVTDMYGTVQNEYQKVSDDFEVCKEDLDKEKRKQ